MRRSAVSYAMILLSLVVLSCGRVITLVFSMFSLYTITYAIPLIVFFSFIAAMSITAFVAERSRKMVKRVTYIILLVFAFLSYVWFSGVPVFSYYKLSGFSSIMIFLLDLISLFSLLILICAVTVAVKPLWECQMCHTKNILRAKFCARCGSPRGMLPQYAQPAPVQQPAQPPRPPQS